MFALVTCGQYYVGVSHHYYKMQKVLLDTIEEVWPANGNMAYNKEISHILVALCALLQPGNIQDIPFS
jgi:hypothetical protein